MVPPPAEAARKPVRIGLALGGGAARGFAHVGVIAVLEEAGLKPQLVVGTSAGSLVAALYASGKTSAQLQQTALNMEEVAITDWMLPIFGRGMFRGDALARYVNDLVANRTLENMAIPLGIVATDLNSGQAVLFQRGDTGTAVRASSAVPAVFLPVEDQRPRVCGWRPGLAGAGALCAADGRRYRGRRRHLQPAGEQPRRRHPANPAADLCHHGQKHQPVRAQGCRCRRAALAHGPQSADFSARQRAIDAGRAAMLAALPQLRAKLEAAALMVQK